MLSFGLSNNADDTDSCAMWAGMGLGKTVVALTAMQQLLRYMEISKVLVVSPKTAAQYTWADEHKQWDHLQDMDVRLITTTPEEDQMNYTGAKAATAIKSRMKGGDVHVVNPERLKDVVQLWGREWPYDMVVIDDTRGLKKPRSKTFMRLKQVAPKVQRYMITNGTPMPNGYLQLWPQIYILDQGKRLKLTHSDYKRNWFYPHENGFTWLPRDGAVDSINGRLSDICISVDGKDYMDLPEEERYVVPVAMEGKLRDQYQELEKEFYLALEEDGEEVIAEGKGILYNKLKQFCNGAVFTNPVDKTKWSVLHDLKLDALENLMEELQGENVLIAYQYTTDLIRLKKRFGKKLHDFKTTKDVKNRWNKGELQMLAMHPGSAGHGLNLQWGGRTVVWFGAEWSLELNAQMNQRVGATRQVQSGLNLTPRYYYLAIENSIEQLIADNVAEKDQTQDGLRSAVKMGLKRKNS